MKEMRMILRHFLAGLSYRTRKALRDAPEDFGSFSAGNGSRTPVELVNHMNGVIGWARTFLIGGNYDPEPTSDLKTETARFDQLLYSLSSDLETDLPLRNITHEQLLHGPLSDAMTHAGQLAFLRRLAGDPIEPENFVKAKIQTRNLGAGQASG